MTFFYLGCLLWWLYKTGWTEKASARSSNGESVVVVIVVDNFEGGGGVFLWCLRWALWKVGKSARSFRKKSGAVVDDVDSVVDDEEADDIRPSVYQLFLICLKKRYSGSKIQFFSAYCTV